MELPAGYERYEADEATVVAQSALAPALLAAGIADPQALVRSAPSALRGRARLAILDLGQPGRFVVRALQRGGLFGKLVRRRSFDPQRALTELRVSAEASARGARVLEIVAAVTRPAHPGYLHGVVSREVADARDLVAVLRSERGRARSHALRAAGRAIRRLHDAGVDHVDLNLKNVLLGPEGEALVIDLDRCRIAPEALGEPLRQANLLRLLRSWTKLGVAEPQAVEPRDPLRLLRAYAGGERPLARRLLASGLRARFRWHKLGWRVSPPRFP